MQPHAKALPPNDQGTYKKLEGLARTSKYSGRSKKCPHSNNVNKCLK